MSDESLPVEDNEQAGLSANFSLWQEQLDRLEAELPAAQAEGDFPEWWWVRSRIDLDNEIKDQIRNGGPGAEDVYTYFQLYTRQNELKGQVQKNRYVYDPLRVVAGEFGAGPLGQALNQEAEDGPLHNNILRVLADTGKKDGGVEVWSDPEMEVLKNAYGLDSLKGLFGIGGDAFKDKVRGMMVSESVVTIIRHTEGDEEKKWPECQEDNHQWMTEVLSRATGIDEAEASSYVFGASRRNTGPSKVPDIIRKFEHFGSDKIRALTNRTGIYGLFSYSIDQLERMDKFVSDPAAVASQLEDHDVNVVMINRFGDHSGIFEDLPDELDAGERTLFFEISSLSDIYRTGSALKKHGINPSTIILAAHSGPGEFATADLRDPEAKKYELAVVAGTTAVSRLINEQTTGNPLEIERPIPQAQGIGRFVADYMKPSRSIDDPAEDEGRKKIIFVACNVATDVDVNTREVLDEQSHEPVDSVVSSLGKNLAAKGVNGVDIYGAASKMQAEKTTLGIIFTDDNVTNVTRRRPIDAVRVRVDRGSITKDAVKEIGLRRAA